MANLDEMTFSEKIELYRSFIHDGKFNDDYRTALIEANLADHPNLEVEFINAQLPVLMQVKRDKTRERFRRILEGGPAAIRMEEPVEEEPIMEEPEPLEPGPVCVFWSQQNADRLGDYASIENPFNKVTGQFNGCSSPDMIERNDTGGMPVCHYTLTDMSQGYVDCNYFEAETDRVVRAKGDLKMVATRTHYPEEEEVKREFKVIDGDSEETFDSLEAANICYRKKVHNQGAANAAVG